MRIGSLCSGYGGLDLATAAVFDAQVAWHAEIDPAANKVLAAHWPDVPNLGDLTSDRFTPRDADIICAGWPCQPFSLAGKRAGTEDERAIWPHIADAVRLVRPRWVVLENVAAVTRAELARATASLAELGYVGSWRCLRAADVGAPHRRNRCFIVAENPDITTGGERRFAAPGQAPVGWSRADARGRGRVAAADAAGNRHGDAGAAGKRGLPTAVVASAAADADGDGRESVRRFDTIRRNPDRCGSEDGTGACREPTPPPCGNQSSSSPWGIYEAAVSRWAEVLGRTAPAPTEPDSRGNGQRLSPRFVEWMMGLPDGWVTAVAGLSRNDRLRLLGNGVVPQQAEAAIRALLEANNAFLHAHVQPIRDIPGTFADPLPPKR